MGWYNALASHLISACFTQFINDVAFRNFAELNSDLEHVEIEVYSAWSGYQMLSLPSHVGPDMLFVYLYAWPEDHILLEAFVGITT